MATFIFDIDGTLVESTDFDSRLYRRAVADVLGEVVIHDDWDAYRHVTDGGILRQILDENGVEDPVGAFETVKSRFVALVDRHLEDAPCRAIPGAGAVLRTLRDAGTRRVGLATGGWGRTAVAKLRSAGLHFPEIPLFSSDHAEARTEIMRRCLEALPAPSGPVTYVGDGPWDLRAASSLGWGFVAIGPRLEGTHRPWIRDFVHFDPEDGGSGGGGPGPGGPGPGNGDP
ncbi:MAG: HAD family hydrolase [Acidobacteriota bacterium]